MKSDKQCKTLINEREKMKQRIIKLKNRKGKVDLGIKMCKNCSKEYHEKDNFNWSCRTHRYDYNGEMWWCCGKKGIEQPGCNVMKHESKDDEDEEDLEEKENGRAKQMKYTRCNCCKELGHTIDACHRDPNIKTKGDPYLDH